MKNQPFPIWCDTCAKQDKCYIGSTIPKCYEPISNCTIEKPSTPIKDFMVNQIDIRGENNK